MPRTRRHLLLALLVALATMLPSMALAATSLPAGFDGSPGFYLRANRSRISAVRAYMSVESGLTIPNIPDQPLVLDRYALHNVLQGTDSCITGDIANFKDESQAQRDEFLIWFRCNTGGGNMYVAANHVMDTTFRSNYVQNFYSPIQHDTWTGQTVQTNDQVYMELSSSGVCWYLKLYNFALGQWDDFTPAGTNNCQLSGGVVGDTAAMVGWRWYIVSATNEAFPTDVLGTSNLMNDTGIQVIDNAVTGVWEDATSEHFYVNGYGPCGNGSCGSSAKIANGHVKGEWGHLDTGGGATDNDLFMCGYGNAQCNYSYQQHDSGYHFEIQRAPTDNSILADSNPKLKNDRSYFFRQFFWYGNYLYQNTVWVDVGNSSLLTVTGQGYTLRYGSTAPTCSWPTATKYQCVSAIGSPVDQVWVKAKTIATGTYTGLSATAGVLPNAGTYGITNTHTFYIAP